MELTVMPPNSSSQSDFLTPDEVQKWLQQELADLAKAAELRTKEATDLAKAYAAGKISPQEAEERLWNYDQRWGEALSGTHVSKGATDEQILAAIDEARNPQFANRLMAKGKLDSNRRKLD
jgi:hypothetical protein